MSDAIRFEDKVVIVTGAGGGLGRAHALLFARHGAKVVVNDLGGSAQGEGANASAADRVVEEIRQAGGTAVANHDSVTDGEKIVQHALDSFGRIDVVVNNAGILRDKTFHKMEDADWDLVYRVHVEGAYKVTRAAWPHMREQGYGRVIFTASTSGIYGNVGQTNYGAAKAGIAAFTIIAARELSRIGVTVNAISPTAYTRMTDNLREYTEDEVAVRDPSWVSPTVVYLASEEAQDITGRVIQAGAGRVAVCEGWRRGAEVDQMEDPAALGPKIREMIAECRKNSGMDGLELD